MQEMIKLAGITWDHPRGYAGLRAVNKAIESEIGGLCVQWDVQSLEDFSARSIAESADEYDFVVYDHPFCGDVSADKILIDLFQYIDKEFVDELRSDVVGHGVDLFTYDGGLWGLPLDAACQHAAFRPDLCDQAGLDQTALRRASIDQIIDTLTDAGYRLAISCQGVGSIMTFFSVCYANGSIPFSTEGSIVPNDVGRRAIGTMRRILSASPPDAFDWNSIACLEQMASREDLAYCPYIFGFSAYSNEAFARSEGHQVIEFTASPASNTGAHGGGSGIIGGAGIGISSKCEYPDVATEYLKSLLSQRRQREMALELAQPGRRSTWEDLKVNKATRDFYRNTIQSIDNGYTRPRGPGFVPRQDAAGVRLEQHLQRGTDSDRILLDLHEAFFGS